MLEKFKSFVLSILVASSLIMSSMLLYATPEYAPIQEMVELGQDLAKEDPYSLDQLKKVRSIDYNDQAGKVMTIYTSDTSYQEVMDWLGIRQLSNLRSTDVSLGSYLQELIENPNPDNTGMVMADSDLANIVGAKSRDLVRISQTNETGEGQIDPGGKDESDPGNTDNPEDINTEEDPKQGEDGEDKEPGNEGPGEGEDPADPNEPGPEPDKPGQEEDPGLEPGHEKEDPDPIDPGPGGEGEPVDLPEEVDPDPDEEEDDPGQTSLVYADYLRINLPSDMPLAYLDTIIPILDLNKLEIKDSYHSLIIYKDLHDSRIKALLLGQGKKLEADSNINLATFNNLLSQLRGRTEKPKGQILDYQLQTIKLADLRNSLFSNPNAVRQILERDQSLIYTDGSRGLRVNSNTEEMEFTSHQGINKQEDEEINIREAMITALDFLNKHQSWTGHYLIEEIKVDGREISISFVEDLAGLSLYSKNAIEPGKFSLKIRNNKVTRFNSSSKYLKVQVQAKSTNLLTKDEMRKKLGKTSLTKAENYRLDLAYYSFHANPEFVKVLPVWILSEDGKGKRIYDASSGVEIR